MGIGSTTFGYEIAADVNDVHLDLFLGHTEVFGHLFAQAPWPFIGRPDFDAFIWVNLHSAEAGFNRVGVFSLA